jgi:hypothetical protein
VSGVVAGKTKVDPELRRQLDEVSEAARKAPVEAVLRLRSPVRRSPRATRRPSTREIAEELFERVAGDLGLHEQDYEWNVFPNLGYAVVCAPSAFIECLLRQPEVVSASANRRP